MPDDMSVGIRQPSSAEETRVATMTTDVEARMQREVAGLKEIITTRADLLQHEIDRRLDALQAYIESVAKDAAAGRRGERDLSEKSIETIKARLDGMDKATNVLQETVTRVPTDVQLQVGNLKDVMEEKFSSVDQQFSERDIRSEREARDNKVAVDAAFAAQKDSATQTDAANAKAIEKSESATTKTIDTLGAVIDSSVKAQSDKHDDLKQRVQALESRISGSAAANATWIAVCGVLVVIVVAALVTHGFTR